MVAFFQRRHALAAIDHHTGALMTEDCREKPLGIGA